MAKRKRAIAEHVGTGAAKALKSKKDEATSAPRHAATHDIAIHQRTEAATNGKAATSKTTEVKSTQNKGEGDSLPDTAIIQVVTGSYERVLHGFAAAIPRSLFDGQCDDILAPESDWPKVDFTDTFLFNAHSSSIRCLALSPLSDKTSKIMLATGSTDERINLYSISTAPPIASKSRPKLPSLHGGSITENPKNKELGSLLHHSSNITALYFPTRSKLLSSAEDSTIAITRTRDWTALSTIKAPIPKPQGRPSGDTAGPGEVPSGINDFAVHPSMKVMLSVGKGEKCMRLWNLITGKKAGVLNFDRTILTAVGEGRFASGEGRRVIWDPEGEGFAVGFEHGIVVFSMDSKPKVQITPMPRTKLHQMHYISPASRPYTLCVSTEDGRVLFYDTNSMLPSEPSKDDKKTPKDNLPAARLIAQLGGPAAGMTSRVKDFEIITLSPSILLIITASSDGTVRFWILDTAGLKTEDSSKATGFTAKQVGMLIGSYSTGTRITCLKAFSMTGTPDSEEEEEDKEEEGVSSDRKDDETDDSVYEST
ncbi:60S ribosome biogenesis protein Mak11 [Pyrenophora tritici-repentis]|uniref:60S ribosome biogenesis protein Mak11 n=3 Tax=Pyrenophora tritici-repentis TaxID=45151 RepID=A0A922NBK3_9PLEO|nr:60S ribosome biogenesis protein Mak11 [Pyrenophora tritici-repentis Pt-1C-BFP]EDU41801.1 60S ribosome biogenesis protein Mak11 [Pyrenophora tritici-repentis Pt-1C-BFP]KAI1512840.1 60S ribosome biogenesis protein Mak11 [Pyrenophora tritici-repentis]KAI1664696.1 60S ribosome biogenesis protein Mak11 [Pyrenophora tritici-repentis]KAI1689797.1 60S ribosome biogenesis protein Mak11 [Pyrenophora tritici-repentis]